MPFITSAALNMGGRPIPGPHWVDVDLGRLCVVERAMIDWEDAFSNSWTLEVAYCTVPCDAVRCSIVLH